MTARLTLFYALSTFTLLFLAMGFLYWVLTNNLAREDSQFLMDKINVLRVLLRERPNDPGALQEEVQWEGSARQASKYYARILDGGYTLIETPHMDMLPSAAFPRSSGLKAIPETAMKWRSADDKPYLLMSALAALGSGSEKPYVLQVALDVSNEEALIADYRRKLGWVLLLGVLISAGIGIVVAHRGLRPLTEITRTAQGITAAQLHARIGTAHWPQELTSLASAFDAMLGRLEESFTQLSQFSADLAHELRTPINILRGETEVVLARIRTPEEYRQVLESSLEEYLRLSRMIDSLLFLARADSPETHIERTVIDAAKELEAVREFYEAMGEEQGVEIVCHGESLVKADPILFRRALSNLLANALQHTPRHGKITLSVAQSTDHTVEVCVADTGIGIAAEHLPRLFDRFYKVDCARSSNAEGTGLGLPIVSSIMALHGGSASMESQPGQGTTVTLRFPSPA